MGIYPDRRTHSHYPQTGGGETWTEVETQPGLTRTRGVTAGPWHVERTDCYCCSCGDRAGADVYCRNHGFAGERPCDAHSMPGTTDVDDKPLLSVQMERARLERA